jgi:hypothetical protein
MNYDILRQTRQPGPIRGRQQRLVVEHKGIVEPAGVFFLANERGVSSLRRLTDSRVRSTNVRRWNLCEEETQLFYFRCSEKPFLPPYLWREC